MVKTALFLIMLVNIGKDNFETQNYEHDLIAWNSKTKLKWSDFKGSKPVSSSYSAASSIQIKVSVRLKKKVTKLFVRCIFDCTKSWHSDTSSYLLNHEQGHFDIGEIVVRKLRLQFSGIRKANGALSMRTIDSLSLHYVNALTKEQSIYDEETNHSLNYDGQREWDLKIERSLDSLKKYKNSRVY